MNKKIKIGLPKGKVHENSLDLINKLLTNKIQKHQLSVSTEQYEFFFLKHKDIALMLKDNRLDFGITSEEWIKEYSLNTSILKKLNWCHTNIALISHNNAPNSIRNCGTEFPNIAKRYFFEKKMNVDVYAINGSSEATVPLLFDSCIDCVETGQTVEQNNLCIKDLIFESDIVFVARNDIDTSIICEVLAMIF